MLEDRLHGRLPWLEILAGATLPSGRPAPVGRRYAEMLVKEERLPLYDFETLRFSIDLHNPGNEAGVPEYDTQQIELALVSDMGYFTTAPGSIFARDLSFEELARQRAAQGALLGELVARLFEATQATFAYADIEATGWVVSEADRLVALATERCRLARSVLAALTVARATAAIAADTAIDLL
jgi:hypothetical protein